MKLQFTKMHGAGNDFIFINSLNQNLVLSTEIAQKLCHRRFGIGADQILIVRSAPMGDFRMEIINADGGVVEMCGNGIRCFAKYVLDEGLTSKTKLAIETLGGMIYPEIIKNHPNNSKETLWVKVDMGEPILEGKKIPVNQEGRVINQLLKLEGTRYSSLSITCVSMGNPHAVLFVDDVDHFPVTEVGSLVEHHPFFPKRVNIEFIEVIDKSHVKMRVWERGTGETLACGTGACAAAVACVLNQKTDRQITLHLKGGDLEIIWDEQDNHVYKTGPATTVFKGEIEI